MATNQAPALLFGVHHVYNSSVVFTPASGWSTVDRRSDGTYHQHQVQDQFVASVGSVASTGTLPAPFDTQGVLVVFTAAVPADVVAPTTPTGLTATPTSETQIALAWNAATDDTAVTGYRIYRDGAQIATTASLAYTDSGLTRGTTYRYAVAAFDAAGNVSPLSPEQSATTFAFDTTAPTVSITSPATGRDGVGAGDGDGDRRR